MGTFPAPGLTSVQTDFGTNGRHCRNPLKVRKFNGSRHTTVPTRGIN
jgi:hypothetical protein